MKLEKKITIEITKEERDALREITNIVEDIFNKEIEDCPDMFALVVSGIYGGYSTIRTSAGDINFEYKS